MYIYVSFNESLTLFITKGSIGYFENFTVLFDPTNIIGCNLIKTINFMTLFDPNKIIRRNMTKSINIKVQFNLFAHEKLKPN